jgi:hypothetical protein
MQEKIHSKRNFFRAACRAWASAAAAAAKSDRADRSRASIRCRNE